MQVFQARAITVPKDVLSDVKHLSEAAGRAMSGMRTPASAQRTRKQSSRWQAGGKPTQKLAAHTSDCVVGHAGGFCSRHGLFALAVLPPIRQRSNHASGGYGHEGVP